MDPYLGCAIEHVIGFDTDQLGTFTREVELQVWIVDDLGIQVVGVAHNTAHSGHLQSCDWGTVETLAVSENFPQHQLVLRPVNQDDLRI